MKIAVLGSMHFSTELNEIAKRLRELGHEAELPAFIKDYLQMRTREEMHAAAAQNKINHDLIRFNWRFVEQNDATLVYNPIHRGIEGYIGANTLIEMAFAHIKGKRNFLYFPIPTMDYTDEIVSMNPIVINGDLTRIIG